MMGGGQARAERHDGAPVDDVDPHRLEPLYEIVDRAYSAISFEPGGEPDWATFRSLFTDPAILALRVFPSDEHIRVMDLDGYERVQFREDLAQGGYEEVPVSRSGRIVRDLGLIDVRFEMRFPNGDVAAALDVFHLVRTPSGWRIASISSDMVDAGDSPNSGESVGAPDVR